MQDLRRFIENIQLAAKRFQEWLNSIDWERVKEVFEYISKQLPIEIEKLSIKLANRGWFIWFMDEPLGDFVEKAHAIIDKPIDEQDEFIATYIEKEVEHIRATLMSEHPERSDQINDAFNTHNAGYFYSSIPSLLALSEGICKDIFPGISLYSKYPQNDKGKPGQPRTADIFEQTPPLEVFEEAVLKPLKISSDVTKSIYKPSNQEHEMLNRHLIVHGTSKNYGSKINSLKAISLVYYVHDSLKYLKNKCI